MGFLGRLVVVVLAALAFGASPALAASQVEISIQGRGAVIGGTAETPDGFNCVRTGDAAPTGVCEANVCVIKCSSAEVRLEPRAAKGFTFRRWVGEACEHWDDRDNSCTFEVDRLQRDGVAVTASFGDVAPPLVDLGKLPGAARGALSLTAAAEDNVGVTTLSFDVNGTLVPATPGAGGWSATVTPSDGAATITAIARDAAGNSTTSKAATVTIDNAAPAITLTGPDGAVFGPGATQSWTIGTADATSIASVRCSIAPAALVPCTDRFDASGLAEGTHTFTVEAADNLGNTGQATRTFTIDATAPVTSIASGLGDGGSTAATSVAWDLAASEPGVSFGCRVYPAALTPGAFAPCSGPTSHTASGFSPGVYTLEVRATDPAGNVEATPIKRTFTILASAVLAARPNPTGDGRILVTLAFAYANSTKKSTKLTSLVVKNVPAGSTVTASCPESCAKKSFKKTNAKGTVSLSPLVKKPLKVGTLITVTISKPGSISAVKILKIQPRKSPTVSTRCQPDGATKPTAC